MNVKEESKTLPAGTVIANLVQFEVVAGAGVLLHKFNHGHIGQLGRRIWKRS